MCYSSESAFLDRHCTFSTRHESSSWKFLTISKKWLLKNVAISLAFSFSHTNTFPFHSLVSSYKYYAISFSYIYLKELDFSRPSYSQEFPVEGIMDQTRLHAKLHFFHVGSVPLLSHWHIILSLIFALSERPYHLCL